MGRRTGLKILRRATAVSVRVRPSALINRKVYTDSTICLNFGTVRVPVRVNPHIK
jgi:hypothetical protein